MERISKWGPAFLVMIIIFASSSIPGATVDSLGLGNEAYQINGHFILYFLLTFFLYRANHNYLCSIIISILYGISDEIHQIYTPFRSSSLFDIYVDTLGSVLAGLLIWKLLPILPKKLKSLLSKLLRI